MLNYIETQLHTVAKANAKGCRDTQMLFIILDIIPLWKKFNLTLVYYNLE